MSTSKHMSQQIFNRFCSLHVDLFLSGDNNYLKIMYSTSLIAAYNIYVLGFSIVYHMYYHRHLNFYYHENLCQSIHPNVHTFEIYMSTHIVNVFLGIPLADPKVVL